MINCNTTEEIYLLSKLCPEALDLSKLECVKSYGLTTDVIRQVAGIWITTVGFLGVAGNIATLTTVPYAAKNKLYGFDRKFRSSTVFILHLALMDFLHCSLIVIPLGIQFSSNQSPFGKFACRIILYGGAATMVVDMLALSLVALSRCLDMVINEKWANFCEKWRNIFCLISSTWIVGVITVIFFFIIEEDGIETGWKCETGGCGFIHSCEKHIEPNPSIGNQNKYKNCAEGISLWRLTYFATLFVPAFSIMIIILSYVGIWYKVRKSTKYFQSQHNPVPSNPILHSKQLSQRDIKMTKTILILIVLNLLFWLPYGLLINTALDLTVEPSPYTKKEYIVTVVLVAIFESQYAINFFVYMARHEQYRNAFFGVTRASRRRRQSTQSSYKLKSHATSCRRSTFNADVQNIQSKDRDTL